MICRDQLQVMFGLLHSDRTGSPSNRLDYSLFHVNLRGALVAVEWEILGINLNLFADFFITPIPFSKLFL